MLQRAVAASCCPAPSRDTLRAYVTAAAYSPNEVGETPKWNIFDIFLANGRLDTKCAELRRIPLLRTRVNRGLERVGRPLAPGARFVYSRWRVKNPAGWAKGRTNQK
jgi:hypothetical protein